MQLCEGSTIYASAIADKVIEVVDDNYADFRPTAGF